MGRAPDERVLLQAEDEQADDAEQEHGEEARGQVEALVAALREREAQYRRRDEHDQRAADVVRHGVRERRRHHVIDLQGGITRIKLYILGAETNHPE